METYDVRCPICGELNHNLYLEETDGWMECEHCHQAVQILAYAKTKPIPIYTGRELAKKFLTSIKKRKFGDHSHGIVQIAVKSPLDIKIPAARSRWNAQNAMQ